MSAGRGLLLMWVVCLAGCDQVANRLAVDLGLRKQESPAAAVESPVEAASAKPSTPPPPPPLESERSAAPRPATATEPARRSEPEKRRSTEVGDGPRERPNTAKTAAGTGSGAPPADTRVVRPPQETPNPPQRVRPVPVYIED